MFVKLGPLSAFCFVVTVAFSRTVKGDNSHIRVVLDAGKPSGVYLIGEPVSVRVELRNESTRVQTVRVPLSSATQNVTYSISSDGQTYTALLPTIAADYAGVPFELPPSQSVQHIEALRHNPEGTNFLVRDPGQYFVRVTWNGATDPRGVESEPLRLTIVKPAGADAAAFAQLDDPETRPAYLGLAAPTARAMTALEQIASGSSAYGPYVALVLSERELSESDINQPAREQRLERALRWLERADREGFPARARVLHLQYRALVMLGQSDRANHAAERLAREFPNSPETTATLKYRETEGDRLTRSSRQGLGPRQAVEPASSVKLGLRSAIARFFGAIEKGDLAAAGEMLSDDFTRNSGLTKARTLEELQEDLDKLKGATLSVVTSDPVFFAEGDDFVLNLEVSFSTSTQPSDVYRHPSRLRLSKQSGEWRITSWDRDEP